MNYLSFIILSFFCFSCTSTEVKKTNQDYKKLKHVVFVPGFYGTKLKSRASGNQVWLTAKNAIFGKENVAVHGFELPYSEKLIPTTILDKVQVIPGVYSKDVYGDIVDYLENIDQQNTMVHTLTYDWRKDYFKAV